jgi:hypothetical protein
MAKRKVQRAEAAAPPPTRKPAPLPKPVDAATMLAKFKDYPAIDVITRRFTDPNDPGSLPILLQDEATNACHNSDHQNKLKAGTVICPLCQQPARIWHVRYFNLAQEGRNAQMRAKGYVPVLIAELKEADDVADLYRSEKDKFVRRGDRGQELLGKMPLELYNEIKRRQRAILAARANSRQALQDDLTEAAGAALGDEAAQGLADGVIKVESMKRERIALGDEAGAED